MKISNEDIILFDYLCKIRYQINKFNQNFAFR